MATDYFQSTVSLYNDERYEGQIDTVEVGNSISKVMTVGTIAPGLAVAKGTAGNVKPYSAVGDVFGGVAVLTDTKAGTYNSEASPLYAINETVPCRNFGSIVVLAESDVVEGANAFIRYAAGTGGTVIGSFRADADTATAKEEPTIKFAESATAGSLVRVTITQIMV